MTAVTIHSDLGAKENKVCHSFHFFPHLFTMKWWDWMPWFFPILLFSSISLDWSLRKAFLSLLAILEILHSDGNIFTFLLRLLLVFFSQPFVRPSQITVLPICISFSWRWFWSLPPVQCHEPLSIVLQAQCLSDLISWIYLSPPVYNHNTCYYVIPERPSVFPYLFQFKSEFCNKEFMIWATVSSDIRVY